MHSKALLCESGGIAHMSRLLSDSSVCLSALSVLAAVCSLHRCAVGIQHCAGNTIVKLHAELVLKRSLILLHPELIYPEIDCTEQPLLDTLQRSIEGLQEMGPWKHRGHKLLARDLRRKVVAMIAAFTSVVPVLGSVMPVLTDLYYGVDDGMRRAQSIEFCNLK
jgi:hypothetical protein